MKSYFYAKAWKRVPPYSAVKEFCQAIGLDVDDTTWWHGTDLDDKIEVGVKAFEKFKQYYNPESYRQRMAIFNSRLKLLMLLREILSTHKYYLVARTFTKRKYKCYSIIQFDAEGNIKEEPKKISNKVANYEVHFD